LRGGFYFGALKKLLKKFPLKISIFDASQICLLVKKSGGN
jgi:hypothetical protein